MTHRLVLRRRALVRVPSHSWHWSAAEWLVCHEEDSVLCRKFHQLVLREVSGGD